MEEMKLEYALRKIANSGNSDLVRGYATALKNAFETANPLKSLTDLLENLIKEFESKNNITLNV